MADNCRILWDNEADQATLACAGAASGFPASMVQDLDRAKVVKKTGANMAITGTLAGRRTCSALVLGNHNLSTGGTIRLATDEGHDQTWDAWESIYRFGRGPFGAGRLGGYPGSRDIERLSSGPVRFIYFSEPWRFSSFTLTLDDPNNGDGYLYLGRLFLGRQLEAARNFPWEFLAGQKGNSQEQVMPDGSKMFIPNPSANTFGLEFRRLSNSDLLSGFRRFAKSVDVHTPFFLDLFPAGTGEQKFWHRGYFRLTGDPQASMRYAHRGDFPLNFEEAL